MKIYLICPVRTGEFKESADAYVEFLESQGNTVHYPPRDTNQNDKTGLNICLQNCKAIHDSDEVHIMWNRNSEGSLFDLGIAFAYNKTIHPVTGCFPRSTGHKDFADMVYDWEEHGLTN